MPHRWRAFRLVNISRSSSLSEADRVIEIRDGSVQRAGG
jgi:hypothetical protein